MTFTTKFPIEFYNEFDLPDDVELRLYDEAEARLDELRGDHNDMTRAEITLREVAHREHHNNYAVNIVVYMRPNNVDATESAEQPQIALKTALDHIERQVRAQRGKLRDKQRGQSNEYTP